MIERKTSRIRVMTKLMVNETLNYRKGRGGGREMTNKPEMFIKKPIIKI